MHTGLGFVPSGRIDSPPQGYRELLFKRLARDHRIDTMTRDTAMTPKQELLNQAAREYKAFHESLQGLNEEHLTEVWLGTWSIKDIVAHIVGWHSEMGPALERIARGERPVPEGVSYDDVDRWNAKFAAERRGAEAADLLLELDKSHERFMHQADAVPEERFQPGKTTYKIVDGNSAHHYHEHGEQIRTWRATKGV